MKSKTESPWNERKPIYGHNTVKIKQMRSYNLII